jgi:hypothetical protein
MEYGSNTAIKTSPICFAGALHPRRAFFIEKIKKWPGLLPGHEYSD